MSGKNKNNDSEKKLDINKSVFQTAKEIQQNETEAEERRAQIIAEREKKKREAHERRLYEERKELLRLKQGVIEDSEVIHEEAPAEVKKTVLQRISSFFYLNKWWLGIGTALALISGLLIYNLATKPRPDMTVLLVSKSSDITSADGIDDYIAQFTDDNNDNGEVLVSMHGVTIYDNEYANYKTGSDAKLTAELESGDTVIIISDDSLDNLFDPDNTYVDLEELFPNNEHVKGCKFMLSGTDFAEKSGIDQRLMTDDMYLAIRRPQKLLYSSKKEMQRTYDRDISAFKKLIEDLS